MKSILSGVAALIGLVLVVTQIPTLLIHLERQSWREATAIVEWSRVTGRRAFHPEIAVRYEWAGETYRDTIEWEVPGFGSKRNRFSVAAAQVAELPPGDSLRVFVDPDNPLRIAATRRFTYSFYLVVTTGILLFVGGGWMSIRNRRSKSER